MNSLSRATWALVVAALVVVVGLAGSIVFEIEASHASGAGQDRAAALAQAEVRVPAMFNFSYTNLAKNLANSEAQTVGTFHGLLTELHDSQMRAVASSEKLGIKATVEGAGVVSAHGSTVEVLVFVNQTRTVNGKPDPQPLCGSLGYCQQRFLATMQKVGSTWKIAGLTTLS